MNKKYMPASNIGTVSLLMILIVLCLVVFATLSLSNAVIEYDYVEKLRDNTAAYNAAEETATQLLYAADEMLYTAAQTMAAGASADMGVSSDINDSSEIDAFLDTDEYYARVGKLLAQTLPEENNPILQIEDGVALLSYQVDIDESHKLAVALELLPPSVDSDAYYRISKWQKVTTTEWSADAQLPVY